MEPEATTDFLVIGAGLAGLAFAEDITTYTDGKTVRLLDKGRGLGGRAATRRWEADGVSVAVDHGAQYFTARGARFEGAVGQGLGEGWLRIWSSGFPVWRDGQIVARPGGHPRYVPPAGMSALPKWLAQGLEVRTAANVTDVVRIPGAYEWQARCTDGRTFTGRTLILNLPPPQLLTLAADLLPTETVEHLRAVVCDPTWTLLLRLDRDVPGADWVGLEFEDHPSLAWASRDHTKRADPYAPPVLVVHANAKWSRDHLEDDPASVQDALMYAVKGALGPLSVAAAQVHRWRYAQPTNLFPDLFFWHPDLAIGGCGDWCDTGPPARGAKVEAALQSGWSLAAAIINPAGSGPG